MDTTLPSGFDPSLVTSRPPPRLGQAPRSSAALDKTAQDFEAMFMTQMLSQMWSGVDVDPVFGGGHGEEMFRSLMIEEQGKAIARSGGLGIATQVKAQLLRLQEAPHP
jgi:Rod binding domain-containing protein